MGIIRARRKSETRVLLLEAGLRVFAERGVELGSLDEVANAAGFTKGAIYRQFPSKERFSWPCSSSTRRWPARAPGRGGRLGSSR